MPQLVLLGAGRVVRPPVRPAASPLARQAGPAASRLRAGGDRNGSPDREAGALTAAVDLRAAGVAA